MGCKYFYDGIVERKVSGLVVKFEEFKENYQQFKVIAPIEINI